MKDKEQELKRKIENLEVDKKKEQRREDVLFCKGWDSESSGVMEAWDRGFDYAKKEQKAKEKEAKDKLKEDVFSLKRGDVKLAKEFNEYLRERIDKIFKEVLGV